MTGAFESLPSALRERARPARLGPGVPALLVHPDWSGPAPTVLWMHGRTANKELDPGRYSRWVRSGMAACAIDLPGHGERLEEDRQDPAASLGVIAQAVEEIDAVLAGLDPGLFDAGRRAIGGMSLGGMIALRRLCEEHAFRCASVEGTTGDLARLYFPPGEDEAAGWPVAHDPRRVAEVDPSRRLEGFEPIPLLALHSEADDMVPWPGQRDFLARLRQHYARRGADPGLIDVRTWPMTGAPFEHVGFGRVSHEAKTAQAEFLAAHLTPTVRGG